MVDEFKNENPEATGKKKDETTSKSRVQLGSPSVTIKEAKAAGY